MERGWLETIHMLGTDLQIAFVLLLLIAERLTALAGWVARVARSRATEAERRSEAAANETSAAAWPPGAWRPSH
jgi:hypothetical protein